MNFQEKVKALRAHHEELLTRKNEPLEWGNGIYEKYKYPILTAEHTPLEWKYDFNEHDNPFLMQRIMMNATLNSGAMKWQGKYILVVRVEGADRKSFFAVAESPNGVDNFRFWDEPITMPDDVIPATNVYDMISPPMKTAGFMVSSVLSATTTLSLAISVPQRQRPVLHVPRT